MIRRVAVLLTVIAGMLVLMVPVAFARPVRNPETEHFAIVPGSFHIVPSVSQAGAYEDLTTQFDFAHTNRGETIGDARTVSIELPPGFLGSSTAVPTCTDSELSKEAAGLPGVLTLSMPECPPASAVGRISLELGGVGPAHSFSTPIFNMTVTSPGVAAEYGFRIVTVPQIVSITVRPGDSGLTATTANIQGLYEPHQISVTIWGVPASHTHDLERDLACEQGQCVHVLSLDPIPAHIPVEPYLSNPTDCGMSTARIEADSWESPSEWSRSETQVGPIDGCNRVPFAPAIEAQPTTDSAESSSGLDVSLVVPQYWDNPYSLASSHLRDAKVTLPEGYTVNPSAGSGVVGCTPEEYARETYSSPAGYGCPAESKLGTIAIETPLLSETIDGNVYLAQPYNNPFSEPGHPNGSLLALYVVAKNLQRGVLVKVAGKVEADPVTGQITSTFQENPKAPFSRFTLKFRQGATSPLVSPPVCGTYTVRAEMTPWSAPLEPHLLSSSFQIDKGVGGGACPSGGTPPFHPFVIGGTSSNAGAHYSPFYLRIGREDGEQEITKFTTVFPPGLTGNLTGIPFCPDAAIEAARQRAGQQELHEPSCPAASEIGHTLVGAGVGSVLAWTPGKVYLAGPYHGSALSIVSVTSATVGPFDLGTVVIRFALRINPRTGQAEIDGTGSDPIPHIIDGIVVHVRDIHVYVDRSKFMLNPTNCEHLTISNTITGAGANVASSADDQTVSVSTPFQAADCASLGFKPTFKATTSGKTSRANGASLNVKVSYPPGSLGSQANLRSVKVNLPRQLPSRLTTLQRACPHAAFEANPASCPSESVVGHAVVHTQLIPVPLTGPAYFVSYGGEEFPKLIIVLQGYGVTIDLVGNTFIKHGVTSSTFRSTPDTPFESFELTFPEGKFSALAANGNLCTGKTITVKKRVKRRVHGRLKTVTVRVKKKGPGLVMPIALTAQNGAVIHQNTPIGVTGCPKTKAKPKKGKKKR